jgi:hypothetical protein
MLATMGSRASSARSVIATCHPTIRRCTALVEFVGFTCLLTPLQNYLRGRGEPRYGGGFISHFLIQVIYPPGLTGGIQIGVGLFVVLVAMVGYGGSLRRHGRARAWRIGH